MSRKPNAPVRRRRIAPPVWVAIVVLLLRLTAYLAVALGAVALLDRGYDLPEVAAAIPVLVAAAMGLARSVRVEQAG